MSPDFLHGQEKIADISYNGCALRRLLVYSMNHSILETADENE